jgi:hypothetical protein
MPRSREETRRASSENFWEGEEISGLASDLERRVAQTRPRRASALFRVLHHKVPLTTSRPPLPSEQYGIYNNRTGTIHDLWFFHRGLLVVANRTGWDDCRYVSLTHLSAPSLTFFAVVHPLVLLSVTDHHARSVARTSNKRVVGVLLGQDNGKTINVANSFGIPFEEDEKDSKTWFLDHNYIEQMFEMFKKVNGP